MEIEYFDTDVISAMNELVSVLVGYIGAITLLLLVGTGVYYMSSQGDPERQKRAKNSFTYILMGLLIVMFSYAILTVIEEIAA
ncbi:MAG: hypothetical protein WC178_00095 [Candidatus Paceibacterota bacterium]